MKTKAALSVILAGVLWGVINIFVRRLAAGGLEPLQISAVRMIVSAVSFTSVLALTDRKKLKVKPKDLWMFAGTGIVSVVMFNVCYFYTMIHSQASVAVVLLYTSPVFIMIMSAVIYREKITLRKIIALILTVGGCVLTAGLIGGEYKVTPFILLTGLGAGLFYALYTIFGRAALAKYDSMTVTCYTFIFGMAGAIPFGNIPQIASHIAAKPSLILWGIGIGIICTVLPYYFYTSGLQNMESGKAAILVAVEPLVGAVIGMTVFHESSDLPKLIGIACILAAIIILGREEDREN